MAQSHAIALLLLTALVAGCSAPQASDPSAVAHSDGRTSVQPVEPASQPHTTEVDLGTTTFVGAAGEESAIPVSVPRDAVLVRLTLSFQPGSVEDLRMTIAGCEAIRVPSAMAAAGSVHLTGECKGVAAGPQDARITMAVGAFVGQLHAVAEVPA